MRSWFVPLVAGLLLLEPRTVAAKEAWPRHVLKVDLLARAVGKDLYGVSFERVPFVVGVGVGRDLEYDTRDVAAPKVELDLVSVGFQVRFYMGGGLWGRHGFYGAASGAYTHGNGPGIDSGNHHRDYRYDGYEVSLLALGYQAIFPGHLALDVSTSFRQALGYLRSGEGDKGTAGGWGVVVAGGLGIAF